MSTPKESKFFRKLSSVVEGCYLEDGLIKPKTGRVQLPTPNLVVPSKAITESFRLQQQTPERNLISFAVVYTMIFFNGCCFTAVVPSVPFYLQQLGAPPSFLGLVVSFYSLGQIVGSPTAGWLNDLMPSKRLLTLSSTLGLFASTLYAAAPNHWFILLSRWLTGVSAGLEFTTELAFIARNTTQEERTTFLASVTAVNVVGFIMGPALTTVLSMLDFEFMGLKVDQYTGPGWLLVIMFVIDLFMVTILFKDSSLSDDDGKNTDGTSPLLKDGGDEQDDVTYGTIPEEEDSDNMENGIKVDATEEASLPSLTVVLSLIFVQFTVMCAWSVLETITSPLAFDSFGWHVQECNLLFTCGGAASLLAYVAFVVASKWIQDRWLIVYALIACFIGLMMMITWVSPLLPPYVYRFVAGYLIMNAGFMTGRPVCFALYSKLIPSQFQGKYLGWMVAGGSAARTLGPFAAVYLYYHIEGPGKNTLALFGSEAAIMVVCLVLVTVLWSSLLPASSKEKSALIDKSTSRVSTTSGTSQNGDISMHVGDKK